MKKLLISFFVLSLSLCLGFFFAFADDSAQDSGFLAASAKEAAFGIPASSLSNSGDALTYSADSSDSKASPLSDGAKTAIIVVIAIGAILVLVVLFKPSKDGKQFGRDSKRNKDFDRGPSPYDRPRERYSKQSSRHESRNGNRHRSDDYDIQYGGHSTRQNGDRPSNDRRYIDDDYGYSNSANGHYDNRDYRNNQYDDYDNYDDNHREYY